MGRLVEARWAGRPLAGLALPSAALALAVAAWSPASEGDGDGPELSPPAGMPAIARPVPPPRVRPATPAPARGGGRAVLALPGITTPAPRTPPIITSSPATTAVEPGPAAGELPLDGPIEMHEDPALARPKPGPATGRAPLPLTLEPLPMDESGVSVDPDPRPSPSTRRTPANSNPNSIRPVPAPAPSRRGRLFGLGPGPVVGSPSSKSSTTGRSLAEESLDEPAAEVALKRRIEKQARERVGERARLIEVKVSGKNVAIQARGVRFMQKRAVRKSLESLPALSGLRSTIDVGD